MARNKVKGAFGVERRISLSKGERLTVALLAVVSVLGAGFAASAWLAGELEFHPALGEPWAGGEGWAIYAPWAFIGWLAKLEAADPGHRVIEDTWFVAVGCAGVGLMFSVIILQRFRTLKKNRVAEVHGSARWAEREDIEAAGLLKGRGVFVGGWIDPKTKKKVYLRHDGPEHVLAIAPTRSGKGVGLVIPTLVSWPASVVVLDIKGENYALTSGIRARRGRVLRFDPTSHETARWNPLAEIRLGTEFETGDVQAVATAIVDPDGTQMTGANAHWAKTARTLLTGAILHVLYRERARGRVGTLSQIYAELQDPRREHQDVLRDWLTYEHDVRGECGWRMPDGLPTRTHPVVALAAREQLNRDPKEASSVLSTATAPLSLYMDPVLSNATGGTDFELDDLMNQERPVSLFLVVQPGALERLKPLLRLLVIMLVLRLTKEMKFEAGKAAPSYKHRLLLLLDEFPSLGRIEPLHTALPFIAGYGLKAYLITQSFKQLGVYGKAEQVVANCHVRVAYAPNEVADAETLSKMTGTTTVLMETRSRSSGKSSSTSTSEQAVQRPLLTPAECMTLPGARKDAAERILEAGHMLVFVAGRPPIYGRQVLYWEDERILRATQIAPPAAACSDASGVRTRSVAFELPVVADPAAARRPPLAPDLTKAGAEELAMLEGDEAVGLLSKVGGAEDFDLGEELESIGAVGEDEEENFDFGDFGEGEK